jgi:hypothetical protein
MAIFSKTKKLPDLRSRRDNLQTRLAAAETTLDGLRNDAVALASDDPGKLSDKAEAAWRIEFEIAALRTAIQKASDEIAAAEEAERNAADRAEREATARVANAMAAAIEKAAVPVPGVLQAFLEAVEAAAPVIGSTGMPDYQGRDGRTKPDPRFEPIERGEPYSVAVAGVSDFSPTPAESA